MPAGPADPILCVGELLWDALPAGLFLGGAPYNVAHHLHQLGRPAALVSRVGDDALGREARRRLGAAGLSDALVQTDADRPTGFVRVALQDDGGPAYDIEQPAAWDAIALTPQLRAAADRARVLVFGSLAQRSDPSRATIRAMLEALPEDALAVFDVNLRPPFADPAVVRASLEAADVVKLNDDELAQLAVWFEVPDDLDDALPVLAARFGCRAVCVTRGPRGAALWHDGRLTAHPGHPVRPVDTVGAGDAFLAALLDALLADASDEQALDRAARLGAYVATQPGATPPHPDPT